MHFATIIAYMFDLINQFTCWWLELHARYMHIVDDSDATDPTVAFRFKACEKGLVAKVEVHSVLCKDIAARGRVPFPPGWAVALKAACLHQLAAAAAQRAQTTRCRLLALADRSPGLPRTDATAPPRVADRCSPAHSVAQSWKPCCRPRSSDPSVPHRG